MIETSAAALLGVYGRTKRRERNSPKPPITLASNPSKRYLSMAMSLSDGCWEAHQFGKRVSTGKDPRPDLLPCHVTHSTLSIYHLVSASADLACHGKIIVAHNYPDRQQTLVTACNKSCLLMVTNPIGPRHCDYQPGREMTQAEWVAAAATFVWGPH